MKRKLEAVDLMVAIGAFATVLGGYFLFTASNGVEWGMKSQQPPVAAPTDIMASMQWVQPALGHTIVDMAVLENEADGNIFEAAGLLNRATMADTSLANSPSPAERVRARNETVQSEHHARGQFVLGNAIVNFTRQGVRAGMLPSLNGSHATTRFLARVSPTSTGEWVPSTFGGEFVTTAQQDAQLKGRLQERIGSAVVQLAKAQHEITASRASLQNQLAALVTAAVQTEARADLFARLAEAEQAIQPKPTTSVSTQVAEAATWPDISVGYLTAGFALLIALFISGLSFPMAPATREAAVSETARDTYRKSA